MRMIVVDEKKLAVESMVEVLKEVGPDFEVDCASGANEALELAKESSYDIAFLDIEMPGMNGIELARHMKELNPQTNIIFVTGYPSYSLEAHSLYPSAFLVKPVTEEDVREALNNLRNPVDWKAKKRMRMDCFGNFEVFVDGKPLKFGRSKTKEMLAYLVDREGAMCTMAEIALALWEEDSKTKITQVRNLVSDLRSSLREVGLEEVLIRSYGTVAVDCDAFDCDYYDFLRADPAAIMRYRGEYMEQYPWAVFTCGKLAAEIGW